MGKKKTPSSLIYRRLFDFSFVRADAFFISIRGFIFFSPVNVRTQDGTCSRNMLSPASSSVVATKGYRLGRPVSIFPYVALLLARAVRMIYPPTFYLLVETLNLPAKQSDARKEGCAGLSAQAEVQQRLKGSHPNHVLSLLSSIHQLASVFPRRPLADLAGTSSPSCHSTFGVGLSSEAAGDPPLQLLMRVKAGYSEEGLTEVRDDSGGGGTSPTTLPQTLAWMYFQIRIF